MNLKKLKGIFTSKFVETGPSSYEKRIYRPTVSQRLRNAGLHGVVCVTGKIRYFFTYCYFKMQSRSV